MDQFLGLRLKLRLHDDSLIEGTVHSIDDSTQQLSLQAVTLGRGRQTIGQFPELTVNGREIRDVEIISSHSHSNSSGTALRPPSSKHQHSGNASASASAKSKSPGSSRQSPPQSRPKTSPTFPDGNARQSLPAGDFDFAASLKRFDKARIFSEIAQSDSVRPEDRLVSINSPQRKLGINEDVLEGPEAKNSIVRAPERKAKIDEIFQEAAAAVRSKEQQQVNLQRSQQVNLQRSQQVNLQQRQLQHSAGSKRTTVDPITAKLMGLSVKSPKASVLIVEDSESEPEPEQTEAAPLETYGLPERNANDLGPMTPEELLTCSLNLAHFLLPSLLTQPPAMLLVLLGVEEESVVALELLTLLCKHGRLPRSCHVYASFAVGGSGRRVELPGSIKALKAQLLRQSAVTFISALGDLCDKATTAASLDSPLIIIDALRDRSSQQQQQQQLISATTQQTLSGLLAQLLRTRPHCRLFGLNGCVLRHGSRLPRLHVVSLGLPQRSVFEAMPVAESLLVVQTGGEREDGGGDVDELFKEAFVCEIEY